MNVETVVQRALVNFRDEVEPLARYLGTSLDAFGTSDEGAAASKLVRELRKAGSHDVKRFLRGGEPAKYQEVAYRVAKHLKIKAKTGWSEERLEAEILRRKFADTLEHLSVDEKRDLFGNANIKAQDVPFGAMSALLATITARALTGKILGVAGNAVFGRALGAVVGPVGWIASGAWLAYDLMGPAYRKIVPAVVHISFLRHLVQNKITIGVVGDGSTGKDALLREVFYLDTDNVNPIAGSTREVEPYGMDDDDTIQIVNYPGFNDTDPEVNSYVNSYLKVTDIFLLVIDLNRGCSDTDREIYKKVVEHDRPVLVCANKIDLVRPGDIGRLLENIEKRLGISRDDYVQTCFDPDERLAAEPKGTSKVLKWVLGQLKETQKSVSSFKRAHAKRKKTAA